MGSSQSEPTSKRTWRSTLDELTASESDPNGECRLDIKRKLPRITWQKQDMRFKPWCKAYGARIQQKFFLQSFKLTNFARIRKRLILGGASMTAGQAILKFVPTIAYDRRRMVMLRWLFLFGAAFVVIGIFLASLPPFAAYLDGALATDRSLTHRLRNNSDHAGIFFVHIYTGMIALALGTFQIYKPLRAAYPNLHRWLGRLYVIVVIISTGTSLGLSPRLSTFGTEYVRQLGAVLWASFTILGVIAIRNSDIESHQRWMTRSYAFAYMGYRLSTRILL